MKSSKEENSDDEKELRKIETSLESLEKQLIEINNQKSQLLQRKKLIEKNVSIKNSEMLASQNWDNSNFPWSQNLKEKLSSLFNLSDFRPQQLSAMNAFISGQNVMLIMPTGGGKSLVYQLPSLIKNKGFTLIVSPLLSLMEDQVFSLQKHNILAFSFSSVSSKDHGNRIYQSMTSSTSNTRLIYVTPEKLAKSKRFMSKLQKSYDLNLFNYLAIDEVHCCSVFGHDFRPDYKFLGVFKKLFPKVPILGLTATATSSVINDVTTILNLPSYHFFKASFNRPNLFYEIRIKSDKQEIVVESLYDLLTNEFFSQSGIIYTLSIKDAENLCGSLAKKGLSVGCYHSNLDGPTRSKIHQKWLQEKIQVVIATIAFGMGIDKSNVRFVIHHSLSKSLENYYQESGRCARDNLPGKCILYYRLADVFRHSTMVFSERNGLEKLYGMLNYCLHLSKCRRKLISEYFDELWRNEDCNGHCDNCFEEKKEKRKYESLDLTALSSNVNDILTKAEERETRLTGVKIVEALMGKGPFKNSERLFEKNRAEDIVGTLLLKDIIREDFHFTPYNTISYLVYGSCVSNLVGHFRIHGVFKEKKQKTKRFIEKEQKEFKRQTKKKKEDVQKNEIIILSSSNESD